MSDKHIDPATKEYQGQLYELDQGYLFSNNQKNWMFTFLINIDKTCSHAFVTSQQSFNYIKALPASEHIGTIIPAPIELDHGKAYTFDYGNRLDAVGVYDKCEKRFYHLRGMYFGFEGCTNIRLMTVESK
jgi:hypothetical protein